MEKSHVSMEAKVCPVCGTKHSYDCGILLDRRLKNSLERETVTGYGMCEEHTKLYKDGYIAVVEIDEEKSEVKNNSHVDPGDAYRTGTIVHIRKKILENMISKKCKSSIIYVNHEFIDILTNINKELNQHKEDKHETKESK